MRNSPPITCGNAADIISAAQHLGILCRPMHHKRYGCQTALQIVPGAFLRVIWYEGKRSTLENWHVSPEEICCDWELITDEALKDEVPF